jgi:hypothetical protein
VDEPAFPKEGPTFRVRHGDGRLDVWSLLPENAAASAVGGPGKEYWVDGRNYPPDRERDPEAGAWRVEVRPKGDRAGHVFLHVLIASDERLSAPLPRVRLDSARGKTAAVEITDRLGTATVDFHTVGETGGHISILREGREIVNERFPSQVVLPESRR